MNDSSLDAYGQALLVVAQAFAAHIVGEHKAVLAELAAAPIPLEDKLYTAFTGGVAAALGHVSQQTSVFVAVLQAAVLVAAEAETKDESGFDTGFKVRWKEETPDD